MDESNLTPHQKYLLSEERKNRNILEFSLVGVIIITAIYAGNQTAARREAETWATAYSAVCEIETGSAKEKELFDTFEIFQDSRSSDYGYEY